MKRINIHVVTPPVFLLLFVFLISSLPPGSPLGPRVTLAASVTVNSTTDVADGNTSSIPNLITNPGADGVIGLREAMQAANNTPGPNMITFSIGTGLQTINLTSALPAVLQPASIDGTTQPGFSGAPLIVLQGGGTAGDGLVLQAGNSTVRGLVINGFSGNGISVPSSNNIIADNFIGTDSTGATGVPNGLNGVIITNGSNNTVGAAGDGNTIAFNTLVGVVVVGTATGNQILANDIFSNGGLGIDLGDDGVTPNDPGDADTGPNNLQNFPVITNVIETNPTTLVFFSLDSTANTTFRIEFFSNVAVDPSGNGEGQVFLDSTTVTTDGTGNFTGFFFANNDAAVGQFVTATATDPSGNTSEFSAPQIVVAPLAAPGPLVVTSTVDASDSNPGNGVCASTATGNPCTLRAAIQEANAAAGTDTINFNIGTGPQTITIGSTPLPTITQSVTINGASQPGFAGTPLIQINGNNILADGIVIVASNCVVRSLIINRFGGNGVTIQNTSVTGNTIAGNFIGTNAAGTAALANAINGILIIGASNNTIGGTTAADRNVISGNTQNGVAVQNSTATGNAITGNFIGTNAAGTASVPNGMNGIRIDAPSTTIGGIAAGAGNTISGNAQVGILIINGGSINNTILRNSIFSNGGLGIDLGGNGVTPNDTGDGDTGPNAFQNFPIITNAIQGSNVISFTLNSTATSLFLVDFFSSPTADPSAHGEGQTFLGSMLVVTNTSGNLSGTGTFTSGTPLTAGQIVTATATNTATGNTSEFSNTRVVTTPTAAKFAEASALHYEGGNVVEWRTGYEVDNLGFDVYREVNGRRTRLTSQMVAGSALFAADHTNLTAGKPYVWVDRNAPANAIYWVEDIDLNGARQLHGPIVPQPATGKELDPRSSRLLNELQAPPSAVTVREGPAVVFSELARSAAGSSSPGQYGPAANSAETAVPPNRRLTLSVNAVGPSSAPLFKLAVDHDGWYRVALPEASRSQLGKLSRPQLSSGGQAVPFRLAKDGVLEFYGQGLDTPTTGERIYWLTTAVQASPQIPQIPAGLTDDKGPATFSFTVERREHMIYTTSLLNGDAENIFGPVVNGTPLVQSLNLKAVDTSQGGTLEVRIQGLTAGAHSVRVLLSGVELGIVQLSNKENLSSTFTIPPQTLHEGVSEVTLQSSGPADVSLVDRVRLTYARQYAADNDQLRFTMAAGFPAKITGFSEANVNVFDITDPSQVTELLINATLDGGSFSISLPAAATARTLLALAGEKSTTTLAGQLTTRSNWQKSSHRADLVLITHGDFRQAAEQLAAHRRTQGLLVEVADVEDLYNEFSDGEHTPQAIRDFLQWAVSHWQKAPRYVLLMGDATWDPRDYLGQGRADFVPTRQIDTALMETSSDDWLADLNEDGLPELAIGRLPVRTAEEAASVVDKLLRYDQATPAVAQEAVFVADTGFEALSAQGQALVPAGQSLRVINRAESTDAETRARILTALNAGPRLVNFVGHGSVTVWTGAGLLRSADAASLSNRDHPSVMIMLTCLNGYAADVFVVSLGEALLLAPNGAAAVWASSGLTDPQSQQEMAQRLYEQLAGGSLRLGDAMVAAKAATANPDVRRTWLLLGDPTISFSWSANTASRKGR